MVKTVEQSLQKEIINEASILSEEKLRMLFQFAKFLSSSSYDQVRNETVNKDLIRKRKKIAGKLKGKIWMADNFNATPDCFKEYI